MLLHVCSTEGSKHFIDEGGLAFGRVGTAFDVLKFDDIAKVQVTRSTEKAPLVFLIRVHQVRDDALKKPVGLLIFLGLVKDLVNVHLGFAVDDSIKLPIVEHANEMLQARQKGVQQRGRCRKHRLLAMEAVAVIWSRLIWHVHLSGKGRQLQSLNFFGEIKLSRSRHARNSP
jgi:hypothetical protein